MVVLDQNDRVFGLLNYKILLGLIFDQNGQLRPLKNIDLQAGIQDVLYIPADVKLDEALRQMQKFQTHMAVVIPAPGSKDMVGIITIEDILEELVGEIYDENDEDLEIKVINHLIFVINPNASATSVAKTLNLPMSLVVDPKAKARNLFLLFFGKKRLKLNHQYENDQLILKVERDLDTRKYRYYVTKKEVITPQTPTSSLRTLLSRNVKGQ